jgi:hypothetical protein
MISHGPTQIYPVKSSFGGAESHLTGRAPTVFLKLLVVSIRFRVQGSRFGKMAQSSQLIAHSKRLEGYKAGKLEGWKARKRSGLQASKPPGFPASQPMSYELEA